MIFTSPATTRKDTAINKWQRAVQDFHEAMDLTTNPLPLVPGKNVVTLRRDLIAEEVKELDEELFWLGIVNTPANYLPAIAKEMADVLYVVIGTAVSFGIDLEPVFAAVHESNMRKVGGPVGENGKRLKPEGWQPPDIAAVLEAQA